MTLDEKLDKLAEDQHTFHGEVRSFMNNTTAYIGAVSSNQKTHEKDPDAHPGASRKAWDSKAAWIVAVVGIVEFAFHLIPMIRK